MERGSQAFQGSPSLFFPYPLKQSFGATSVAFVLLDYDLSAETSSEYGSISSILCRVHLRSLQILVPSVKCGDEPVGLRSRGGMCECLL